jgi:hypothetical protein
MGKVMNIIGKFEKIFHFIYGIAQKIHFSKIKRINNLKNNKNEKK